MKNKILNLGLVSLIGIVGLISSVTAHTGEDEYAHHSMMGGMMTGVYGYSGMLLGWLFGILILVALVLLIVWLIKQIQRKK